MYTQLTSDKAAVDKANAELTKTAGIGLIVSPLAGGVVYGMGGNAITAQALSKSLLAAIYVKAYLFTVGPLLSSMTHAATQYKADVEACGPQ